MRNNWLRLLFFGLIIFFSQQNNAFTMFEDESIEHERRSISSNQLNEYENEESNEFPLQELSVSSALFREEVIKENTLSYLEKYFIEEQDVSENNKKKILRKLLKFTIPPFLAGASGLPLLEVACQVTDGHIILCPLLTGGTLIALGGASAWAGLKLISQLEPVSQEEKKILQISAKNRIGKNIGISLVAILSSVPDVSVAYKYNSFKPLAIVSFFTSFVFKSQGYHEFFSYFPTLQRQLFHSKKDRETSKIVDNVYKTITPSLLQDESTPIEDLKVEIKQHINQFIQSANINTLFVDETDVSPLLWRMGYPRKMVQGLSLIFPIGNTLVNGIFAYDGLNLLFSSPIICTSGAVVVVVPGFFLDVMATASNTGEFFDIAYNKLKKRDHQTFYSRYYPKLSKFNHFFSFAISTCFAITITYITYDTVSNSIFEPLKHVLPLTALGTGVMFGSYTTSVLGQDLIEQVVARWGSARERSKLFMIKKLETVKEFISSFFFTKEINQD